MPGERRIDFARLPRNLYFLKASWRCNFDGAINLSHGPLDARPTRRREPQQSRLIGRQGFADSASFCLSLEQYQSRRALLLPAVPRLSEYASRAQKLFRLGYCLAVSAEAPACPDQRVYALRQLEVGSSS